MTGLELKITTNGRPRIKFDLSELEKLCAMQCTRPEIASWFSCSLETIDKRIADDKTFYEVDGVAGDVGDGEWVGTSEKINLTFHEIMQRGYARGKISMRRQQIKMLNEGNGTMAVWLGKQYLGQKDIVHHANPDGSPIENGSPVDVFIDRLLVLVARRRDGVSGGGSPQGHIGNGSQPDDMELEIVGESETD